MELKTLQGVRFGCYRIKPNSIKDMQTLEVSNEADLLQQEWQVSFLHSIVLNNNIFSKNGLQRAKFAAYPRATFKLTPKGTNHSVSISWIADTGAQSNLWG